MKKEIAKQYIQNQITGVSQILEKNVYDRAGRKRIRRDSFSVIKKYIDHFLSHASEPRWIIMPGLRGVGKTTVVSQLYFEYERQLKERILYVSADEITKILDLSLRDALEAYQEILGESFTNIKKPVILFIDEIHYDARWAYYLKSLYDKTNKVFILATGSSAVSLKVNPDIARRALIKKLHPLKFSEYLVMKNTRQKNTSVQSNKELSKKLTKTLFQSNSAQEVYRKLEKLRLHILAFYKGLDKMEIKNYLTYGTLPSTLEFENNIDRFQILLQVISKVINDDIPNLKRFSINVLEKIENILFMAASSDAISLTSLSKSLGDIDIKTLTAIFNVLEKAKILFRVHPFGSVYKKIRKPSKYLFLCAALRAALLSVVDARDIDLHYAGKLLEDVVGMYLYCEFFERPDSTITYDSAQKGADFILQLRQVKIVIEVGKKKEKLDQVINTMNKTQAEYGLVISDVPLTYSKEHNIVTVPLDWFLLS